MGNLTATEERARLVDFSDPAMKGVAEVAVTVAGASPIGAAADLAGKERGLDPNVWFIRSALA